MRWSRHIPFFEHVPVVKTVLSADFGLHRGRAIVAGTDASRFYAFTPTGDELWYYEINHGANDGCAADVNGDGVDEILAVTEWNIWHCIDGRGKGLWRMRPLLSPGANQIEVADIDGDGRLEALIAAIDAHVYARNAATGEDLWKFYAGDEITRIQPMADVGAQGVLTGSYNGYVYLLDGSGGVKWKQFVEEAVRSIVLWPSLEAPPQARLLIGTDGGFVFQLMADGTIEHIWEMEAPVRCMLLGDSDRGQQELVVATVDGRIQSLPLQI